ncbi:SDR family NAD(P)-dependent oxidoreductase [Novosphingobium sp.]|uniref:SDR family NAD(P)-dependent oxidoreductase n=1 Tax=Novosphingobium sp. TaxID=1874826 RepID=UPI0035638623
MENNSDHSGGISRPKRVLLIGASGELGGALARLYAASGANLCLWGRDARRLAEIAQECRNVGAKSVDVRALDLRDIDQAIAAIGRDDDTLPFDMAIIASGLGDIRAEGALVEDPALVARLGQVNFVAPAAIAAELGARMAQRKCGTIVLIGSAAAFHALPFAAAYAGSKAGLARFADALRINLRPHGITVTLVSPGFIDTAAGRQVSGPKSLIMQPAHVANAIAKAAARGQAHLITPWPFALLRLIDRALPRFVRDRLLQSLTPPDR